MNIGIYISNPGPSEGGAFTFESSILNAFINQDESNHHFFVFHNNTKTTFADNANLKFVLVKKSFYEKIINKLFKVFSAIIKRFNNNLTYKFSTPLDKAVLNNNVDILWFVSPFYEPVETPFIVTIWDLQHRLQPYLVENLSKWTWQKREDFYQVSLPRASFIITGSEIGKMEIMKFYNIAERLIIKIKLPTPNFVLQNNYKSNKIDVFSTFNIGNKNYLFYPAQFWPHKNHIALLKALKDLKENENINFDLVFTGSDKGNQKYIRELSYQLKIDKNVHFLGFVTIDELKALYKSAFALVFASFFGPDNIPPLEAMSLGCPVICSNSEGMEEQLDDAALFFDPKNYLEITKQVVKLYNDEKLKLALIDKGKKRALSWTSEDYVKKLISVCEDFKPIRETWSNKEKYIPND